MKNYWLEQSQTAQSETLSKQDWQRIKDTWNAPSTVTCTVKVYCPGSDNVYYKDRFLELLENFHRRNSNSMGLKEKNPQYCENTLTRDRIELILDQPVEQLELKFVI